MPMVVLFNNPVLRFSRMSDLEVSERYTIKVACPLPLDDPLNLIDTLTVLNGENVIDSFGQNLLNCNLALEYIILNPSPVISTGFLSTLLLYQLHISAPFARTPEKDAPSKGTWFTDISFNVPVNPPMFIPSRIFAACKPAISAWIQLTPFR